MAWSHILKILRNTHAHAQLLELIDKFSKVARHNIQKSIVFLYTSNIKSENKIKEKNSIYNSIKQIKYLGINITKEV